MILGHTIKDYKRENLLHDVITGIIIMAVSIPISMGYSQIAGLPAVYGLYGSVFPIILLHYFLHLRSSSLEWMRHQQRWLDQHFLG